MRAFIAIELPSAIKDGLVRIREELRRSFSSASWVKPDAMHLTLRFLGDINEDAAKTLCADLRARYASAPCIDLRVGHVGAFPNARKPAIIWVGVEPFDGPLQQAQLIAEEGAAALGLARENRPFHPHLTLARVRQPARAPVLTDAIARLAEVDVGAFTVTAVSLFSSELSPRGPRHTRIEEFSLRWSMSAEPFTAC